MLSFDFRVLKKNIMEDTIMIAKEGTSKITIKMGTIYYAYKQPPILLNILLYNRYLRYF